MVPSGRPVFLERLFWRREVSTIGKFLFFRRERYRQLVYGILDKKVQPRKNVLWLRKKDQRDRFTIGKGWIVEGIREERKEVPVMSANCFFATVIFLPRPTDAYSHPTAQKRTDTAVWSTRFSCNVDLGSHEEQQDPTNNWTMLQGKTRRWLTRPQLQQSLAVIVGKRVRR